jgi:hypothetical protein
MALALLAPVRAAADDGLVLLHVDSPVELRVEHRERRGPWKTVCAPPCDVLVPTRGGYRVVADDVPACTLSLEGVSDGGRVIERVAPGDADLRTTGILGIVGGGTALGSALVWAFATSLSTMGLPCDAASKDYLGHSACDRSYLGPGLLAAGGAAALALGIWAVVAGRTRVAVSPPSR